MKNFDGKLWDENAKACVRDGLILKFTQNKWMKDELLSTGNKILVEASPTGFAAKLNIDVVASSDRHTRRPPDRIWGIGFNEKDALSVGVEKWGK